jgi:hypothetical protein
MFKRGDVLFFIMIVGKRFFVGRMQSSYYARLRRKMILDRKKRGVDSFNGASPSQDTVNSYKLIIKFILHLHTKLRCFCASRGFATSLN